MNCADNLHYKIASVDHLGKWNSTSEKNVTVNDNDAPSADAGPDQTIVEGSVIIFNGTGSLDNINIANYTWFFNTTRSTIMLYDPNPQYIFSVPGNYSICLVVTDTAGNVNNDTMNIIVLLDTDDDGIENIADDDDDGDGYLDEWETFLETNPEDSTDKPIDSDGDGIPDGDAVNSQSWMDTDDNDNGILDVDEEEPSDSIVSDDLGLLNWWWLILIVLIVIIIVLYSLFRKKENQT